MSATRQQSKIMLRFFFVISVVLSTVLLLLPVIPGGTDIISGWGAFAGRLHILIIHFPIVLVLILLVVWLAIHLLKKSGFSIILPWLWVFTILACLASVAAGYLLYRSGEYEGSLVQSHFWGGVVTAVSVLWGGFAYFKSLSGSGTHWGRAHVLLLFFAAASVTYTGHLGGSLTHGSDFLTEVIPVRKSNPETDARNIKDPESLLIFDDILIPVFKTHCTSCHNTSRKKGGLVLGSFADMNKGGKSGKPMIVAQLPDSSELYRRIILPVDHDDRMPPEGKKGLGMEETLILKWWIESGADTRDTLGSGPDDPEMQSVIRGYLPYLSKQLQLMAAEAEARKKLIPELSQLGSRLGLNIQPDPETDSAFFAVSMELPPQQITDATLEALSEYSPVFSRISLVASDITDDGLFYLSRMSNLQRLILQKTCIAGEGLVFLKDLPRLEVLNLSHTNLTNEWALELISFPSLVEVYIFNTLADPNVIEALDKHIVSAKVSLEEGPYF